MATLRVPHDVPPPNADAEAIKEAFRGNRSLCIGVLFCFAFFLLGLIGSFYDDRIVA